MKTIKKVQFWRELEELEEEKCSSDVLFASVLLLEDFDSHDYPIATWPASLVLAAFIANNPKIFHRRSVLELGAGTALPSLLCAHPIIGSSFVYLSERPEESDLQAIIEREIILNNCYDTCISMPLDWSEADADQQLLDMLNGNIIDIILGADIFYCDEDFPSLFRMLNTLFQHFPHAICYTTYQLRSDKRTIWPWLERYGLCCEEIQREQFLSTSHRLGICTVQNQTTGENIHEKEKETNLNIVPLQQFDDIFLFCIRKML